MLDKNYVTNELARYSLTDAAIQKMSDEYLPLKIEGLKDKEGYAKVHAARMVVKGKRIEVEKTRKELKEDSLAFGRTVDAEAKRITGLLKPIEDHLSAEEGRIDEIKAEIKRKEEVAKRREIEERERKLREELERKRKEEEAMLAAQRAEQEREAAKLAAERAEIEAERRRVEDERRAVEAEKQRAIEAERRRVELEQARKEATEKARREAELEAQQKAEAKRRAEEERKAEEARRLAEAPDKEKLQHAICNYWPVHCEGLKTKAAKGVLETFNVELDNALEKVRRYIDGNG